MALNNALNTISLSSGIVCSDGAGGINASIFTEETAVHGWNGSLLETATVTVTSDGATITLSIDKLGGGDLDVVFSDGFYAWDTTPADTITLTAGTDTVPQTNYVYFLQSTKALTVSTVGWPAAEHAALASVICQSAASLQTEGPYNHHSWIDDVVNVADDMGNISDLSSWIRGQNATWISGVAPTLTITPNGGAPDNVIFTSTAGVVLQLKDHVFPAFAGTPDIYVINDSATAYDKVTDLNTQLTDSTGASMSGRYFSLVIWGVVCEVGGDCKLFCNLPAGSYNNEATLIQDADKVADFSIPADYKGTGFLIAELQLRHQAAASGTWTEIDTIDLRGLLPGRGLGGVTSAQTTFDDSTFRIFDDTDDSKEIAFQASGITTATTRTMTVQDSDGTIAYLSDISGNITWNEETGTSASMAVNNGYIANNAGLVTLTLPTTAALGEVVRITGKGAGGWRIAQNAGETIYFGTSTTTTGVGGMLDSTADRDTVELVCVTADTDWNVTSSIGNVTVT